MHPVRWRALIAQFSQWSQRRRRDGIALLQDGMAQDAAILHPGSARPYRANRRFCCRPWQAQQGQTASLPAGHHRSRHFAGQRWPSCLCRVRPRVWYGACGGELARGHPRARHRPRPECACLSQPPARMAERVSWCSNTLSAQLPGMALDPRRQENYLAGAGLAARAGHRLVLLAFAGRWWLAAFCRAKTRWAGPRAWPASWRSPAALPRWRRSGSATGCAGPAPRR